MKSSPLIPTPRTDKNGRTVIRHMKNLGSSSSVQPKNLPPVKATTDAALRKERVHSITMILAKYTNLTGGNYWYDSLENFSDEQLGKLQDICDEMEDRWVNRQIPMTADMKHVQDHVMLTGPSKIEFFHKYRQETNSGYSYVQMDNTLRTLKTLGLAESPNMDAHIKATMLYTPLGDPESNIFKTASYFLDRKLIKFIERHPDRVEEIMAFRTQRNSERYSDLEKYLKEKDELKAPAVMGGWL